MTRSVLMVPAASVRDNRSSRRRRRMQAHSDGKSETWAQCGRWATARRRAVAMTRRGNPITGRDTLTSLRKERTANRWRGRPICGARGLDRREDAAIAISMPGVQRSGKQAELVRMCRRLATMRITWAIGSMIKKC